MREIKFRVWDEKDRIMSKVISLDEIVSSMPEELFGKYLRHPYNWLQYIGLKDKNGKEIYEGDILRQFAVLGGQAYIREVVFEYGAFSVKNSNGYLLISFFKQVEIIGNIYENADLIGG